MENQGKKKSLKVILILLIELLLTTIVVSLIGWGDRIVSIFTMVTLLVFVIFMMVFLFGFLRSLISLEPRQRNQKLIMMLVGLVFFFIAVFLFDRYVFRINDTLTTLSVFR